MATNSVCAKDAHFTNRDSIASDQHNMAHTWNDVSDLSGLFLYFVVIWFFFLLFTLAPMRVELEIGDPAGTRRR